MWIKKFSITLIAILITLYKLCIPSASSDSPAESMAAYQRFLANEQEIFFDMYQENGFNADKGYSLTAYLDEKSKHSELQLQDYYDIEYGYIDCGNDGIPELIIKYTFIGEMSDFEGDYEFQNVIKYVNGRLEMCAETLSHYRSNESVNKYGIICSWGSDFAGANFCASYSYIGKNGIIHPFMYTCDSFGEAIPRIYRGYESEPDFRKIADLCDELYDNLHIYSSTILGEEKAQIIYSYQLFDENTDHTIITDLFNRADVSWYEYEQYNQIMIQTINKLGLTHDQFYDYIVEYTPLEINQ